MLMALVPLFAQSKIYIGGEPANTPIATAAAPGEAH